MCVGGRWVGEGSSKFCSRSKSYQVMQMFTRHFLLRSFVPRRHLLTSSWWNLTLVILWCCLLSLVGNVKWTMMLTYILSGGTLGPAILDCAVSTLS